MHTHRRAQAGGCTLAEPHEIEECAQHCDALSELSAAAADRGCDVEGAAMAFAIATWREARWLSFMPLLVGGRPADFEGGFAEWAVEPHYPVECLPKNVRFISAVACLRPCRQNVCAKSYLGRFARR